MITITLDLAALRNFNVAAGALGTGKAMKIVVQSLNQIGDKAYTAVKGELVKQMGINPGSVGKGLKKIKAGSGSLEYRIKGTGHFFNLASFGGQWNREARGAFSKAWSRPRSYPGTFMVGRKTIFKRVSKDRLPIKAVYGPAIPREMERDNVPAVFDRIAEHELPKRIDDKLAQFMPF